MMEGALNRNRTPKRSIMVGVATFVSLVLLAGLVVVGAAAGAEDPAGPRSSVLTTVVEEVRPVSVVDSRKLSKNSKASNNAGLSEEDARSLLRAMVFEKAVDVYRSMQPAPSLAEEEEAAARADTNESGGHKLLGFDVHYNEYACTGCAGFFSWGTQLTSDEREDFCYNVLILVSVTAIYWLPDKFLRFFFDHCMEILQCPLTPTMCCQSQGVCLNWKSRNPRKTQYS